MHFEPGMRITGSIELRQIVGEGGMGQVWAAEHVLLRRPVAVKRLAPQFADNTEALQRFATEAQAGARAEGANVTRVFDYALLADGTPFLVMELLEGEELHSRIRDGQVVSLDETTQIVVQICAALSSIHQLGIVHRDVKPENIFLVPNGAGGFTAKLIDFGIAKVSATSHCGRPTGTGHGILGTPPYMSPEQFENAGAVDGRADLWSLAVVAYTSLTGRMPFEGDSLAALCLAIRRATFVPVTRRRPELPLALDDWFGKALGEDLSSRFATATEMAEGFVHAAQGEGATPLPTTRDRRRLELVFTPPVTRRRRRRDRGSGALGALAIIAALAGAAAAVPRAHALGGSPESADGGIVRAFQGAHGVWEALPTWMRDAAVLMQSEGRETREPAHPRVARQAIAR